MVVIAVFLQFLHGIDLRNPLPTYKKSWKMEGREGWRLRASVCTASNRIGRDSALQRHHCRDFDMQRLPSAL